MTSVDKADHNLQIVNETHTVTSQSKFCKVYNYTRKIRRQLVTEMVPTYPYKQGSLALPDIFDIHAVYADSQESHSQRKSQFNCLATDTNEVVWLELKTIVQLRAGRGLSGCGFSRQRLSTLVRQRGVLEVCTDQHCVL